MAEPYRGSTATVSGVGCVWNRRGPWIRRWMLDHHEFWVTDQSNDRGTGTHGWSCFESLVEGYRSCRALTAMPKNNVSWSC